MIAISSLLAVDCEESKQRSISDLYNFRFDPCIERLEELLEACPNDPLVPFLHISARWQKELFHEPTRDRTNVMLRTCRTRVSAPLSSPSLRAC